MRFKIAIALAVLGLLLLGLGVGQKTLWKPPATVTATVPAGTKAGPVTVVTSELLKNQSGPVTVTVKSGGPIFLATGRADDVDAWVGKATHLTIAGADADFAHLNTSFQAGDRTVPNPAGSDLWTSEQTGSKELTYSWDSSAASDSLLIATNGKTNAANDISATVAHDTATPWAVPLVILGIIALAAALLLFLARPTGGRGRRGGPGPRKGEGSRTQSPTGTGSTAIGEGPAEPTRPTPRGVHRPGLRRTGAAGAAVVLTAAFGAAGLGTASADTASPSPSDSSAPASDSAAAPPSAGQAPVVNDAQFTRIVDAVAKAATAGDAAKDATELAPRFDGAALSMRAGNYKVRSQVADYPAVPPVTSTKLLTRIVSTNRAWPRSFVAVTQGPGDKVPQILTLVEMTPRTNYKLISATGLLPGQTLPLADPNGAPTLAPADKSGLQYSTNEALAAVSDRLTKTASSWKSKIPDNAYIADTLAYETKSTTDSPDAKLVFSHAVVDGSVHTFRAADGGALVMANLAFNISATPKTPGVTLSFVKSDAPVFAGGKETKKGYELNYTEPVVVYIPASSAKTPLTLLAANRGLIGAKFK